MQRPAIVLQASTAIGPGTPATRSAAVSVPLKAITVIREIADEKADAVRQAVIEIAEENGEQPGALGPLQLESKW